MKKKFKFKNCSKFIVLKNIQYPQNMQKQMCQNEKDIST